MRIGITYNLKDEPLPTAIINSEWNEEFDTRETIDALSGVFEKNGFKTARLGSGVDIIDRIRKEKIDFVFNMAEGYSGRNRESHVPAILEMLGVPYSGSDPLTLGLTLDKIVTKKIARQARILTPNHCVVKRIEDVANVENVLQYPLILKPAWEGSSKGIYNSSRVLHTRELEEGVKALFKKYIGQPVLVEEYIRGREITVGVIGNDIPRALGLMEIENQKNPGEDFFYSLEIKRDWKNTVSYVVPPKIPESIDRQIRYNAIVAFKEFGCRDIARVDFRISEYNKIFFLEINPMPGLSPDYGDLVIMARKLGVRYGALIMSILNNAFSRCGFIKKEDDLSKPDFNHEKV